ncbi:MAG: hypothetical protein AAGA85_21045 [Bacteroidota bacterium]
MNETTNEPIYLRKSVTLYKIYGGLFLFSILSSVLLRPILKGTDMLDVLVGLPIMIMFFLVPVGLFYSWKSFKRKEGRSSTRFRYFMGHMFFFLLMVLFVMTLINDLREVL